MAISLEHLGELIGEIYDAALQPSRWPAALNRLGEALDGAAFVMSALHRSQGVLLGVTTLQDAGATEVLRTRFSQARYNPLVAAMSGLPVGQLVWRRSVYADAAYFKSELYNEIFRGQELVHHVVACLDRTEEMVCPLGVLRPRRAGDFSAAQTHLLGIVLPHLRRAVQISLRLGGLEGSLLSSRAALDRVPLAIFIVDSRGTAVHANAAARAMAREQDGLWMRNGEFFAWQHKEAAALRQAIARTAAKLEEGTEAFTIHRRSGKPPYLVVVAPLGACSASQLDLPPGAAIVLAGDAAASRRERERVLRALFGLSSREAQLAEAFLQGKRLEEYASERGISINTAKTQLRAVFAKTDTRRQAELIRLLDAMPVVSAGAATPR